MNCSVDVTCNVSELRDKCTFIGCSNVPSG